ncbi:MAG: phosphatase PAP2 family protein [Deltaproteobacteria bacterium]|nr:phosphatase PAP2 family protein [Deltaproteobacteria bacterium]
MNGILERKGALTIIACALGALFAALNLDFIAGTIPQTPSLVSASRVMSFAGNGIVLAGICILIFFTGLVFKSQRIKYSGLDGFYSALLAGAFVQILKAAFERPRPAYAGRFVMELLENPAFFDASGRFNSIPSGHTTVSFAVAYALGRNYPRLRIPLYAAAALVAASRVYLGSHFPSDVVAGAILGLTAGWLITAKLYSRTNWLIAGLLILAIFVSFFKTGSLLLFDVDEAVFSEASREMAETGDYITPTYNYEPRYDKPILIYWFMSSAYRLFGVNEFAARFTSSAFGVLLVMMTFFFMRRIKGGLPAFFAAIALLLNIEYFVYTHSAVTDMTLAFFITASLFSFFLAVHENDGRWAAAFWVSSAAAVLTKGAVGLLFPVSVGFLYLLASRNLSMAAMFLAPRHLLIFIAAAAPWFIAETYVNGMDFINAFVIKHHFKRYTEVISSHGGPFYYYLGVLALGFFPWVCFVPEAVYKGFTQLRNGKGGLYLFSAIWFLFVLIFFSISSTKLPNYIFPLMPAGAVLAGLLIGDLADMEPARRTKSLYLLIMLSAVFAAAMFIIPHMELKAEIALPHRLLWGIGAIFLAILGLSLAAGSKPLASLTAIGFMMISLLAVLRLYALPPVNIYFQKDLYDFAQYAKKLGKDTRLAAYEINQPSIAFYAQRRVPKVEKARTCDIKEYSKAGKLLVITQKAKAGELAEFQELKPIAERGKYVLLGNIPDAPPFAP